jgi:Fic family protein
MAVMHYQFEAIHPFTDGNGRTGRIMNILYLMSDGLLDLPVLYLSRYIIKHKNSYYQGLRDVTEKQQWEQWVLFNLSGIAETAKSTKEKVIAIKSLLEKTNATVKAKLPKIYSKELVEAVFQLPYCKIKFLVDAGLGIRDMASLYVKELERIGILKSDKVGREVLYINQPLYDLLIS